MPEKETPPERAAYPPIVGEEAGSPGAFGSEDPPHPGSGWISPFRIGLAVVLLAAALIGWQLSRTSSPAYRTAAVGTGTVVATLTSVGTITPVNQANLNFNVSGTVSAVDVSVGHTVTEGQTLASLDVADLNAAVVSAQATLASATVTLSNAEASETATTTTDTTTSTASTTGASASPTATTVPASAATQPSQDDQRINQLQATLVADQKQEDVDSAQATEALKQATAVCDAAVSTTATAPAAGTSTAPAAGTSTTPASGTSTTPSAPPGGAPPASPPTATETCSDALAQASAAQSKVTADIRTVEQDESALNAALSSSSGTGGGAPTGGSGTGGYGGGGGGTRSTGGTTGGTSGATTSGNSSGSAAAAATTGASSGAGAGSSTASTPKAESSTTPAKKAATPQQLAVDQASIDTAQANLTDSQQALSGANLVSTIAGTVASVSIAAGDSVTAGSTSGTAQIVIIGTGSSYEVATDIPVASIGEVSVGQQVLITPDSTNTVLNGQVEAIGVLASSGSTSTTYPVTISLQSPDLGQLSGADANVAIVVKRSVGVTTVPSSAVRTVGSVHLVTVVDDNNTGKPVRVTLGTVGATLTQVTSGVSVGQTVALADLNEPLPSTSSTTTRFGGGLGGGGLTGGGLGGGAGGFGGGGGFGRFAG